MTTLFFGSMRSRKTELLIESLVRETYGKKKAVVIRTDHDTRDFLARDKKLPKTIDVLQVNPDWHPGNYNLDQYKAIGLDEIHFFKGNWLREFLITYSNKNIYCTSLLFGKTQEPFESVTSVFPLIDKFIQCTSICEIRGKDCQNEGTITFLKEELNASEKFVEANQKTGNAETDDSLTGDSLYSVCCKNCFLEFIYPKRRLEGKSF